MIRVPLYLDEPPTILGARPDEAAVFMLIFFPAFLFNWTLLGLLGGIIITALVKRWRAGKPEGFLVHYAYRHLGIPAPVKGVPGAPMYADFYST